VQTLKEYLDKTSTDIQPVTFKVSGGTWGFILETLESSIDFIIAKGSPGLAEELGDIRDLIELSLETVIPETAFNPK
jgi:hypothetical protein